MFNPLYYASTTLVDMVASSVGTGTAGGTITITSDTASTSGGTVQDADIIYNNAAGSFPYYLLKPYPLAVNITISERAIINKALF